MIRRVLLLDHPQETRFFLFVGLFGLVLTAIYWALTSELAGTTLLFGFGAGAALLGIGLLRSRPRAVAEGARHRADRRRPDADTSPARQLEAGGEADLPGGGAGGVDTPFEDESGRLPGETLAPLSLGLGLALALTAIVFGPWLAVAGLLPIAWGAWTWLTGARDELDAMVADEAAREGAPAGRLMPSASDGTDSGTPPPVARAARPDA